MGAVSATAHLASLPIPSTVFPAMKTAENVMGQILMPAQSVLVPPQCCTMANALLTALKALIMKKTLKTVKVFFNIKAGTKSDLDPVFRSVIPKLYAV